MIGTRVSFTGAQGPVTGVLVSIWVFAGVEYALVRDASGGYHGYRVEEVCHD